MIVNTEQRENRLLVSYADKKGGISFKQFNIPANQQFKYVYALQRNNALPNIKSWDNKPVRKVPSRFLNRTRIQEFFLDAGEENVKDLFELNIPKLASCDIEVEVDDDGFPDAFEARNKVTTIAWCTYPNVYVFGMKPLSGTQTAEIESNINKHIEKTGKEYRFIYIQHDSESNMLSDFMFNYVKPAPLVTGWNFWGYDWPYLMKRCEKLGINVRNLSPTKQWYRHKIMNRGKKTFINLPQHKLIVDYLEIYKKWDRTIDPKENNTLDYVADRALGFKKVKYPGTFQELYEKDFDQHVFYNAIDTIIVEMLHWKLKTMNTFLGLANITRVDAMNSFSPIQMLEASMVSYARKRNMVFPENRDMKERQDYEGAFVFDPKPDLYEWVVSLDAASLYPTIMRQFKISIENFVKKDKSYIPKEHEIKCASGAVFDASEEPLLPELLTDFYNQRKSAKKISFQAEIEAEELKKIMKRRKKTSAV